MASYVPLNVHSHYSFLDSTLSIPAIIALARQYEVPALALTDTGNLHGAVEFCLAAKAAGIKPLVGAEVAVDGQPVWLYVENVTGYANLCRLLSQNDNRQPPVDEESCQRLVSLRLAQLDGLTDGLLAVSQHRELADRFRGRHYRAVFAAKDRQGTDPGVLMPPVHYTLPSDRQKFDIVQSIRTRTLLRQAHPGKRLTGNYHFRTPGEVQAAVRHLPELLNHTQELADRCTFALSAAPPQFPAYQPPDGTTPHEYLRTLVLAGLKERYRERASRLLPQIEEELSIIAEVGYEEYFLVMWDILQDCRKQGIDWITRGSAADSLVCYCLGISGVCPIRFDLYFRRFLNKERMAMNKLPDIDVDFPHDRKDDVVDLIFAKYGRGQAAIVGGFSTFQARSAVAEVAKVLGVSEFQIRRITEHFPWANAADITAALAQKLECRDLPIHEEPFRTALEMAAFLDGFPRYPKMHPCGVVLARQPIHELTPTFISNKGYATTHFDMDAVESIGLVKMDILAQGGLAAMRDTQRFLQPRGITVDLAGLEPWEDPLVWEMLASGGSRAVHHIESPAMVGLCRQCGVRDIDGLIAIVSVIRPGAANEGKKQAFVRRYQGLEPVVYPHPSLEACLRSTFGLVVYEEHILQICEAFAGLPAGRADVLRRALSKGKPALIEEIRLEFLATARKRGHPEEKIAEVWDLVSGFAGYAFCKAHSAAYGVEAYQSAWLKRYHPVEFMAAVLTNGKGFYSPLVYVLECHRLGIPLLPPTANQPGSHFGVEDQSIRVPLTRVKGLSQRTQERLVKERQHAEFTSLRDFYQRVVPSREEMESMLRVGGFDEFGQSRTAQFWEVQQVYNAYAGTTDSSQGWLLPPPATNRVPSVELQEPTRCQRLMWETDLLGFTASGHPLELFPDVAWDTYCPVNRLGEFIGQQVVTCGLIIEQRTHSQVTGEPMKFLTLADRTGIVETELFAATYRSYALATVRYPVLEVAATVEPFANGRGFSLRVLHAGKPRTCVR